MDQGIYEGAAAATNMLAKKSWTAYVGTVVISLILLVIDSAISRGHVGLGLLVFILIAALAAYRVMEINSYRLYYDDSGVWLESGILPWKKGVRGVKWRDVDEAVFFQSFGSWIFKSYKIRVGHRFTKDAEIVVTHVNRGKDAVISINGMHQNLVKKGALQ